MHCQKLKTYMETGRVVFVPARSIQPNPAQPRRVFREDSLQELTDSIRAHGILQDTEKRLLDIAANNPYFQLFDCTCPFVKGIPLLLTNAQPSASLFSTV